MHPLQNNVLYGPSRSRAVTLLVHPEWLRHYINDCLEHLTAPQAADLVASSQQISAMVDLPGLKCRLAERRLLKQLLPLVQTPLNLTPVPDALLQLKDEAAQLIIDLAEAVSAKEISHVQPVPDVLLNAKRAKGKHKVGGCTQNEYLRVEQLIRSARSALAASLVASRPFSPLLTGLIALRSPQQIAELWQQESLRLQADFQALTP